MKAAAATSIRELALLLERNPTTVLSWSKRKDWPFGAAPWSTRDVDEIRQWAAATLRPDRDRYHRRTAWGDEEPEPEGQPESASLERLRRIRADLAQLELDRQRGTHVELAQLSQSLVRFAACIRRAGEMLQRRFGPEAATILNEQVDVAEEEMRRVLPQRKPKRLRLNTEE